MKNKFKLTADQWIGIMNIALFIMWIVIGAIVMCDDTNPSKLEYFCVWIVMITYVIKDAILSFHRD